MSTPDYDGMFGMDLQSMIEHGGHVPTLPEAAPGEKKMRQLSVSAILSCSPSGFFDSLGSEDLVSPLLDDPLSMLASPTRAAVPTQFGAGDQAAVLLPNATASPTPAPTPASAASHSSSDSSSDSESDSESDGDWSAPSPVARAPRSTRARRARQAAAAAAAATAAASTSALAPLSAYADPASVQAAAAAAAGVPFVATNNKRALDAKWSEELLNMEQNEFRTFCRRSGLSKKELSDLKQARRRAKNRAYAKASRARRLSKERRQVGEHTVARREYDALQRECNALRARNAELEAQHEQLLAFVMQSGLPLEAELASASVAMSEQ